MELVHNRYSFIQMLSLLVGLSFQALAAQPGEPVPALLLPQLGDGKVVRLADFEGKVVYVDFWASWCGPCRQSLPLYESLYKRLPLDRFQILAVNLDENTRDAEQFLERHPVSYPVLLDPSGDSARAWSVRAMPSSYLVGADGRLAKNYAGFEASHIGDIENDIKSLLDHMPVTDAVGTDSLR